MEAVGVSAAGHRSYQLRERDVRDADLIVAMAAEHVLYVRRTHPAAAARTGTIKRLVRDLAVAGPGAEPLPGRVAHLGLATVALEPWEDVHDPAGGDLDVFVDCANELVPLVASLAERLP
jgi:protein-tyrosine-phosphatase